MASGKLEEEIQQAESHKINILILENHKFVLILILFKETAGAVSTLIFHYSFIICH